MKKETLKVIFDDIDEAAEKFFGRYSPEPPKDLVEVVRCKDCRKRGGEDCPMYHWQDISIYQGNDIWDEDHEITDNTEDRGFCHKGERGEE